MAKETVSTKDSAAKSGAAAQQASRDEIIGYHKGCIAVLTKEREEMLRIVQITEQLLQMHMKGLADLGVDLKEFANQQAKQSGASGEQPKKKVPIEHLI